jgi:hypothetical protein
MIMSVEVKLKYARRETKEERKDRTKLMEFPVIGRYMTA